MITIENEEKNTQQSILRKHFEMLYPDKLKDDEWIRLVGIRKDETGSPESTLVKFIKSYDEYEEFVFKYRYTYDLYNQIATNKGNENGNARSQRCRKVLYMDFDQKDYPNMTDAEQFTELIKSKIPKLFLIACVNSGHGYHFYISIKQSCKIAEITKLNKELVEILGADPKAALSTQIARIPCSYNHKCENGMYDYLDPDKWIYVKTVFNAYENGPQFKQLTQKYIQSLIKDFRDRTEQCLIYDDTKWDYTQEGEQCYLCIKKVMNEGIIEGQRNFWHGRIVKMLQKDGYTEEKIYSLCKEYNSRCNPPKSEKVILEDTKRFIETPYNLLGCYKAFPENDPRHMWIACQCDEAYCRSFQNGITIESEAGDRAKLNKKILTNKHLKTMSGNEFLIITILNVYMVAFTKKAYRVKDLKKVLTSSVQNKQCMCDQTLKNCLANLEARGVIAITDDKKYPDKFDEKHLVLTRKIKEFQKGFIEFYFSVSGALIDGRITQRDYVVFITLVRNLSLNKSATYDQLAEDLDMHKSNIAKCIKHLEKERCLIIEKVGSEKGVECNKYHLGNPVSNKRENNTKVVLLR